MSTHDELVAALGAQLCDEMERVAANVLAQDPRRGAMRAELARLVATCCDVIDATIDDTDTAHIRFTGGATLHAGIDRAVIGTLVDPALRFTVGGFWEEADGWILGWQSSDGSVFVQTTVRGAQITHDDNQPG